MLQFLSIGSGSSGNCYYLRSADDAMLIDCGVGIRTMKRHLKEAGIGLDTIKRILITHEHADHIKAVSPLSNEYHIPVYATAAVHRGITSCFCVSKQIPDDCARIVVPDQTQTLGAFRVTPFAVPHDSAGNMGYCIEAEGATLVLLTDVGHVTDTIGPYIARANYLVIEANHDSEMLRAGHYPEHLKVRIAGPDGHLSNRDCGEAIAQCATSELRHVWLCHLSEENNHPVLAVKTVEQILRTYGIVAGKDFIVSDLKRKTPSQIYDLSN